LSDTYDYNKPYTMQRAEKAMLENNLTPEEFLKLGKNLLPETEC